MNKNQSWRRSIACPHQVCGLEKEKKCVFFVTICSYKNNLTNINNRTYVVCLEIAGKDDHGMKKNTASEVARKKKFELSHKYLK